MLSIIFYIYSFLLVGSAFLVITLKNPVHSVLFLIFAFFNAAGLFIMLGAEFIAMMLVIVYVGAVAVLFLFIVMMMNIKIEEVRQGFVKNAILGLVLSGIIFVQMYVALSNSIKFVPSSCNDLASSLTNTEQLGMVLYTDCFIVFQLSGLILLAAMIGAIVLTITHTQGVRRQNITNQLMRTRANSLEMVDVENDRGIVL